MYKLRLVYISYLRILAIAMIVLYHCLCYYTSHWPYHEVYIQWYDSLASILHSFSMPLFVCISGYLFFYFRDRGKYQSAKGTIINKFKRLIVPALFWVLVLMIVLQDFDWTRFLTGYRHLWFLYMLFWIFCIASIVLASINTPPRKLTVIISMIMLIGISTVADRFLGHPLNKFGFISPFAYLYAFYAGYCCNRFHLVFNHQWIWLSLLMLVFCITAVRGCFIMDNIRKTSCVGIFIILFSYLRGVNLKELSAQLKSLDSCCMGIYIFHHLYLDKLLQYESVHEFFNQHLYTPFILAPILFLVCWGSTYLFKKIKLFKYFI